jgi:N-acetylneuraminic acid mutarotase
VATGLVITVPVLLTGSTEQSAAPAKQRPTPPSPGGSAISYPSTGPGSAAALEQGHWSRLPTAPIPGRTGQAAVWTGRQMLIWGGESGYQDADLRSDGAAYDAATNSWSTLPTGPLSGRSGMAAVWTGQDMFIWGGDDNNSLGSFHAAADGALYDPTTQQWRRVPASPLSARVYATALWTGSEVVVTGGQPAVETSQRSYTDAAAYDPTTNTWRRLPAPPTPHRPHIESVVAVAAGRSIYAWLSWDHLTRHAPMGGSRSGNESSGVDVDRYDTSTGRWTQVHATGDLPTGVHSPVWTGSEIIMPAAFQCPFSCPVEYGTFGWRFSPRTNTWTAIARGPGNALDSQAAWTGSALLAFNNDSSINGGHATAIRPGDMEVWAPNTNRWTALPRAPYSGDTQDISAVWTGDRLLMWGQMGPDRGTNKTPHGKSQTIGLSYAG